MKFNILLLLFFAFVLSLISCSKETITKEGPEIILNPPIEIDYPVVTGLTRDGNKTLGDVRISVYQNGTFKGETYSDSDGQFNTSKIETKRNEDIILLIEKDSYNSAYRKRTEDEIRQEPITIELIKDDEIYGNSTSLNNLSGEDYISLSGYIKDLDNASSRAFIAVEYEIEDKNGQVFYSASTKTDSEGYYELLLAKDVEWRVSIFSDTICFNYFTQQEVSIYLNLQAEVMGPFSEDIVLDDYINPYVNALELSISGDILSCDGGEVTASSLTVEINDNDGNYYFNVLENLNSGSFLFSEDRCLQIPYNIKVYGKDNGGNVLTDTLEIDVNQLSYVLEDIELEACNEIDAGFSTAIMNIDGTEFEFNQIITRLENSNLIADELTDSYANFLIPDAEVGSNIILNFELADWFTGNYFKAVNSPMPINIISFSSNSALVEITGTFLNVNNQSVSGTCSLNLKF